MGKLFAIYKCLGLYLVDQAGKIPAYVKLRKVLKLSLNPSEVSMRHSLYTLILCLFLSLPFFLKGEEKSPALNWEQTLSKLSGQLLDFSGKKGKFRLAMLPLAPTTGEKQSNEFGKYFTDQITVLLSQKKDLSFKIFERKQLEVILEEHAFSSSSIVSQKDAIKMGELAPVDILFTGSYTKLKNYIAIHISLLDVLSGEILLALKTDLQLTPDLNELFTQVKISDKNIFQPQIKVCQEKREKILSLLNNLTSEERISAVTQTASETELFSPCGELHLDILQSFQKHKLIQQSYQRFLAEQLSQLQFIANRETLRAALHALEYLAIDGELDLKEFNLGLFVTGKLTINYNFDYFFKTLLDIPYYKPDSLDTLKTRVNLIFAAVEQKKLGLPLPIDLDTAYMEMLEALEPHRSSDPIDSNPLIYVIGKYQPKVSSKTRSNSFRKILYALRKEKNPELEKGLIATLINYFSLQEPTADLGSQLLELYSWAGDNQKRPLLRPLISKSQKALEQSLNLMQYQKNNRIKFCMEFKLPCSKLMPEMQKLLQDLRSTTIQAQLDALDILLLLKTKALPAESRLLKIIEYVKQKRITDPAAPQLLTKAILVSGAIPSKLPAIHEQLILYVYDPQLPFGKESEVNQAAKEALLNIGPQVLPSLLKRLNSPDAEVKTSILKVIGQFGKQANKILSPLKQLQKKEKDDFIKDRYQDAIESISQ